MYEIRFEDGLYYIYCNGVKLDIDGFIDPISPKKIIEMIKDEV